MKQPGLLELLSSPWNTILPDALSLGLSAADDDPSTEGRSIELANLILGLREGANGFGVGLLSRSSESLGRSSISWPEEEEDDDRERREEAISGDEEAAEGLDPR